MLLLATQPEASFGKFTLFLLLSLNKILSTVLVYLFSFFFTPCLSKPVCINLDAEFQTYLL